MDGGMEGWMGGRAGLRIAYSNQKLFCAKKPCWKEGWVEGWMDGWVGKPG